MGLEPTRCNHHKILSLARLPVPTLPQAKNIINEFDINVKDKIINYKRKNAEAFLNKIKKNSSK